MSLRRRSSALFCKEAIDTTSPIYRDAMTSYIDLLDEDEIFYVEDGTGKFHWLPSCIRYGECNGRCTVESKDYKPLKIFDLVKYKCNNKPDYYAKENGRI